MEALETMSVHAVLTFFFVGFPMLHEALPHVHEFGDFGKGDGEADDV